ncbi:unnamed protein product, partial [Rotaria sordida]
MKNKTSRSKKKKVFADKKEKIGNGENSGNDRNNETLSEPENESQQEANIKETEVKLSTEEINVSIGGTKRKISWKGGSKN